MCRQLPAPFLRQAKLLALLTLILVVCFSKPLYDLLRFSLKSDLFSHVLLVPFISIYLIFLKRGNLEEGTTPDRKWAFATSLAAVAALLGYALSPQTEYLTWTMLAFYLLFLSACLFCLKRELVRRFAFPIGFLLFMIPFPAWLTAQIEFFLQYTSAVTAQAIFAVIDMPVIRDSLWFQLPGMRLEVAPECSGIHSTLVLFLTSLLAGELFLTTRWKKALLCLAVIPLGILRNGVRICTIGYLCVHVSPDMIDSPIHRRGGPLFFAASLIPFFCLLWLLRRSERHNQPATAPKPNA